MAATIHADTSEEQLNKRLIFRFIARPRNHRGWRNRIGQEVTTGNFLPCLMDGRISVCCAMNEKVLKTDENGTELL